MRRAAKPLILSLFATGLLVAAFALPAGQVQAAKPKPPNILFIIMDDVGIDQFQKTFGFGAENAAPTPVMDTLASSGLRFRNVWAMAECSPSRALMLTGRYPLRTHVYAPLQPADLANSQVSPYETAVPKVLKHAGYASALFGKHHVGGAENYPNGDQSPALFGFDYFHGPMGGKTAGAKPDPIDTTAGGVGVEGTYPCGYVPNLAADAHNGADSGACYFADDRSCRVITVTDDEPHPGRACLQQGGILVPEASCEKNPPPRTRLRGDECLLRLELRGDRSGRRRDQAETTDRLSLPDLLAHRDHHRCDRLDPRAERTVDGHGLVPGHSRPVSAAPAVAHARP